MRLCTIVFLICWLALPTAVYSQTPTLSEAERKEVGALLLDAKKAFDAGEYARSIDFLERAYVTFPDPNVLFRIGQCHENLGDVKLAIAYYRRYIDGAKDAPDLETVRVKIEQLESSLKVAPTTGTLLVRSTPSGISVTVDDTSKSTPAEFELSPGSYQVRATADEFEPYSGQVDVRVGETNNLYIPLRAIERSPVKKRSRVVPWTLVALGGSSLVLSAVTFGVSVDAAAKLTDFDEARNLAYVRGEPIPDRPRDYDTIDRRKQTFRQLSIVTGAVGVTATAVGVVLLLTMRETKVALTGSGATISGSF